MGFNSGFKGLKGRTPRRVAGLVQHRIAKHLLA